MRARPLQIKKLLDDEHDEDDLDADLTVADVFVNNGKARSDGLDQRGTVRVVQKPTPHAPVRYPSVALDWDKAALDYERIKGKQKKTKQDVTKFSPIAEEPRKDSLTDSSLSGPYGSKGRRPSDDASDVDIPPLRDVPVQSVERDEPEVPPSPPRWGDESPVLVHDSQDRGRLASKELGISPTPVPPPRKEDLPPVVEEDPFVEDVVESVPPESVPPESVSEPAQEVPSVPPQPEQEEEPVRETASKPLPEPAAPAEQTKDVEMTDVEPNSPPVAKNQRNSPVVVIDNSQEQEQKGSFADKFVAAANRKRKKSSEQLAPKKEPRLDLSSTPSSTRPKGKVLVTAENPEAQPATSSPQRRRERAPSFSSPQRRPSIDGSADPSRPGLGLGITRSPQSKKTAMLNSSQEPVQATPVFSQSAPSDRRSSLSLPNDNTPSKAPKPGVEQVKKLTSALRKESSPADRNRSVSFAEETEIVTPTTTSRATPKTGSKLPKTTPTSSGSAEKSIGTVVWPPNVPQEKLQQYQSEAAQKESKQNEEKAEWERKIAAAEKDNADSEYLELLRSAYSRWSELREMEKKSWKYSKSQLNRVARELEKKEQQIREKEGGSKKASARKPGKQKQPQAQKKNDQKSPASTNAGDQKTASKACNQGTAQKAKSVEPSPAANNPPAETTEKDATPQSSIVSDDSNLPPTDKVRSAQETKGKKDSPASVRAKTVAKRTITKVDLTQDNGKTEPEAEAVSEPQSKSESNEKVAEEKTSEQPAAESNDAETREEAEEPEISKAEMLQNHQSPSVAQANSKPASVAPATNDTEPASQDTTDDRASGSASESGDSESDESDDSEEEEESSEEDVSSKTANGLDTATKSRAPSFNFSSGWTPVNGVKSPGLSSSQPKSLLSNGVSSRPDLKSLKAMMEETTQEARKKAQEKAPERGSRASRPGRKSIFDPPSDSESSESESESDDDSEDDGTESSGDDSRGDILPTGKAQRMRKALTRRDRG